MKFRGPIFLSVAALTFLFAAFFPHSLNDTEKEAILVRTILTFVEQLHFDPKPVDDDYSKELYNFYLDRMDGMHRFLTQEDLAQFENYQLKLDDEIRDGNYEFFDTSLEHLNAAIEKTQMYYKEILNHPFDLDKKEFFETDPDKRGFAANDTELKEVWRKYLKYETLVRVARKLDQEQDKGEEIETKSREELEAEARKDVEEMYDDYYQRLGKLRRSDRLSIYLNTITQLFDPHSAYYEPIAKENFDIHMAGQYDGIGARLVLDGDFTKVSEVMPGGPAWRGKEIKENDLILKVAQGEDGEWQDVVGWVLDDVVQLIRGKKGTTVRLMIRRPDGTEQEILLVRDVIKTEETFAKSLILDNEEGEKIGYIYLPSFYANFQDPNGRFCSKDVAQEVEKLKEEKVDGIVLDLRDNGGGSLGEVIRMTGLFIEQGPVVQVKSRNRKPEVYRDVDSRVQYDGPLAVMVNSFSASASEILAAALQDYNRAVIVGSKSTFGKGTVQRFFDMDRFIRGKDDLKPLGNVKVTTQKFYRVNGGSTQLKGVTPDIVFPDNYYLTDIGEREESYPLSWTEVEEVSHNQNVYRISDMTDIQRKSQKRIEESKEFQEVLEYVNQVAENQKVTNYPLQLEAYQQFISQREEEAKKYRDMFKAVVNNNVENLRVDIPTVQSNEKSIARNEDFITKVSKDIYIEETLNILGDMIK